MENLFYKSKGSTISRTNDIVRDLDFHDEYTEVQTGVRNDNIRLSQLYGSGVRGLSKIKKHKKKREKSISLTAYEYDEKDWISCEHKIIQCQVLITEGVTPLNNSQSELSITVGELKTLLETTVQVNTQSLTTI